jgi:UDP-2-acetamido-2-deoxy-ribo-hexuluronate aminotransferase
MQGLKITFAGLDRQYELLKTQIQERINSVFNHGQYIMGPEVVELENKLANYVGSEYCVTVGSGTEALMISLMAINIRPGDEVITTSFTFAATVEVILMLGATPVYVDIDSGTCNLDINQLKEKITSKTKAIIPVSLYGLTCDMDEINSIASEFGEIPVIEDGAQSFGAIYKGNKSCNLSTIGCTSFFPSKPLGCYGDGGAIFTSNESIAVAAQQIRVHGQSERYLHTRLGICGRMDTIQCAIVLAKLDYFDNEIEVRRDLARRYDQAFGSQNEKIKTDLLLLNILEDRQSAYAQYTLRVENRDAWIKALNSAGIPTSIHYPMPVNEQPAYRFLAGCTKTPIASKIAKEVFSLPIHPYLTHEEQTEIIKAVLEIREHGF